MLWEIRENIQDVDCSDLRDSGKVLKDCFISRNPNSIDSDNLKGLMIRCIERGNPSVPFFIHRWSTLASSEV